MATSGVRIVTVVRLHCPNEACGWGGPPLEASANVLDDTARCPRCRTPLVAGTGAAYPPGDSANMPMGGRQAIMQADADGLPSVRSTPDIPPPVIVRCTDQEWAFIRHLCGDRLDGDTALVFADWLEENGRDAAGNRVRLLRPGPGDLLVVWPHAGVGEGWRPGLAAVAAELAHRHGIASWVVMSHPGQDIATADPAQLRAAGWVRREELEEEVRRGRRARVETLQMLRELFLSRGEVYSAAVVTQEINVVRDSEPACRGDRVSGGTDE